MLCRKLAKLRAKNVQYSSVIYRANHLTTENSEIDLFILNPCWMDVASGKKICFRNPPGDPGKHILSGSVALYVQLA